MLNVINVQAKVSCTQWSTRIDIKARRQYWKARSYIALHSLSLSGLYISVTNSHPYPKSWKSIFYFYQTNSSLTCKTRCRVCKNVFIYELDYRVLAVGVLIYYYITLLKHTIVKWLYLGAHELVMAGTEWTELTSNIKWLLRYYILLYRVPLLAAVMGQTYSYSKYLHLQHSLENQTKHEWKKHCEFKNKITTTDRNLIACYKETKTSRTITCLLVNCPVCVMYLLCRRALRTPRDSEYQNGERNLINVKQYKILGQN